MKATKIWILALLLLIPLIPFGTDTLAVVRETEPNNTVVTASPSYFKATEAAEQRSPMVSDPTKLTIQTELMGPPSLSADGKTIAWVRQDGYTLMAYRQESGSTLTFPFNFPVYNSTFAGAKIV